MTEQPDADAAFDEDAVSHSIAGVGVSSESTEDGPVGSVTVGGYDALRLEVLGDLPGGLSSAAGLIAFADQASHGEWSGLPDAAADAADVMFNGFAYAADPLNFLITAGLTFLVDVVQPLQDLVGLVSGNAERMGGEIEKWQRVGAALGPLAEEIRAATDQELVGWSGLAAEAAKARLHEFADGVASMTNDVLNLKTVLDIVSALMAAAESLIMSIIATFVEWLVLTWVPALAAAAPTLGGSTAAAAAVTAAEAAVTTSRAALFIERVMRVLHKLQNLLEQVQPALMAKVHTNFGMLGSMGGLVPSQITAGRAIEGVVTDLAGTHLPPAVGAAITAGVDGSEIITSDAPRLSRDDQHRALDPDR